jgi:hypothetical protein
MCLKWCEEALSASEKEPGEQELLITAIKNFSKEKKSQNVVGYDSEDEFFCEAEEGAGTPSSRTTMMRGTMSSFKIKRDQDGNIVLKERGAAVAGSTNGG